MMNDDEHHLQRRFDAWAEQEQQAAPNFERVWRRAERRVEMPEPSRASRGWRRFASVGAAVLAAFAVWLVTHDSSPLRPVIATVDHGDSLPAPIQDEFTAPTDFLLATSRDNPVGQLADEISALLRP